MDIFVVSAVCGCALGFAYHVLAPSSSMPLNYWVRRFLQARTGDNVATFLFQLLIVGALLFLGYLVVHSRSLPPYDPTLMPSTSTLIRVALGVSFGIILRDYITHVSPNPNVNAGARRASSVVPKLFRPQLILLAFLLLIGGLRVDTWIDRLSSLKIGPGGAELALTGTGRLGTPDRSVSEAIVAPTGQPPTASIRTLSLFGLVSAVSDFDAERLHQISYLMSASGILKPNNSQAERNDEIKQLLGGRKTELLIDSYVKPVANCGIVIDTYMPNQKDQASTFARIADSVRHLSSAALTEQQSALARRRTFTELEAEALETLYELSWVIIKAGPLLHHRISQQMKQKIEPQWASLESCRRLISLFCRDIPDSTIEQWLLALKNPSRMCLGSVADVNTTLKELRPLDFASSLIDQGPSDTELSVEVRRLAAAGIEVDQSTIKALKEFRSRLAMFLENASEVTDRPYSARSSAWLLAASGDWMAGVMELNFWLQQQRESTGAKKAAKSIDLWHMLGVRQDIASILENQIQADPGNARLRRYQRENLQKILGAYVGEPTISDSLRSLGAGRLERGFTGRYVKVDDPCDFKLAPTSNFSQEETTAAIRIALQITSVRISYMEHALRDPDWSRVRHEISDIAKQVISTSWACAKETPALPIDNRDALHAMYRAYVVYLSARLDLAILRRRSSLLDEKDLKEQAQSIRDKLALVHDLVSKYKHDDDQLSEGKPFPYMLLGNSVDDVYYSALKLRDEVDAVLLSARQ